MGSAFWNIVFSLFFAVLLVVGFGWLTNTGQFTPYIPLGDFCLISLAIFRLVRLFSYDLITKFIRDWFETEPPESFLGTLSSLIHCPWCTGLWFSFVVVFFYYATALAWPLILVLALAGVGSFLQTLSNLAGWSAELKKRTVLGPEHKSTSTCG